MRRVLTIIGLVVGGGLAAGAIGAGGWCYRNATYLERGMAAVAGAGYTEKQTTVDGSVIHYAEGPDNGPALLLIHGQEVDWKNYRRVLPELSRRYHVFAVDCYGHGSSARVPEKYSAAALGRDLHTFLTEVVREPVIVAGHSSGGHLAAWLGANAQDTVRAVLLEDPPFFTTTMPRARTTWNYVDLATMTHTFLAAGETDWVGYSLEHSRIWGFFGDSAENFKRQGRRYHAAHPGEGIRWWSLPPVMNETFRASAGYDPRFGDAFYTGSWDEGWDQADTLSRISVPSTLVHTAVRYDEQGILMAAMGDEEAARARDLLPHGRFVKVETGHGFHDEAPRQYIALVDELNRR